MFSFTWLKRLYENEKQEEWVIPCLQQAGRLDRESIKIIRLWIPARQCPSKAGLKNRAFDRLSQE